MKEAKRIVTNADNQLCLPAGDESCVIGYVDDVNGNGAAEVSGFVPTRHELIQLLEYWERKAIDTEFWWFLYGQVGSSDMRLCAFARQRVYRIRDLLDEEAVQQAIDRAHAEVGKDVDPSLWDVFLHGDETARSAAQEELRRRMESEGDQR